MKKSRFRPFAAIFAALALAACLGFWLADYLAEAPRLPAALGQADKADANQPGQEAGAVSAPQRLPQAAFGSAAASRPFVLPAAAPSLARLGAAQKKQIAAEARKDAEAAALAAGQTEALAAEAGQAAEAAAQEAVSRPSAIGGAP